MSLETVINFPATAAASVAASQTPDEAGNLILVTNVGNTPVPPVIFPAIMTTITLTSSSNTSTAHYTLVGENIYGVVTTEVLAGPNVTTVSSVNQYHKLYSISVDSSGAGDPISVGNIGPATSMWVNGDHFRPMAQTSIRAAITGTVNYSMVQTLDDPITTATPDTFAIVAGLTAATTPQFYYLTSPWGGIQATTTAGSTGTVRIGILQQGVRA